MSALERTAPLKPRFNGATVPANENRHRNIAAQLEAEADLVALFEALHRWRDGE